MTDVSGVRAALASQQAAASQDVTAGGSKSVATIEYEAFLKLLIAQMKNQDPLEPMNSTDYIAQLATFSSVEQAVKTNEKLDSIFSALHSAQASELIGKAVLPPDGSPGGVVDSVRITSSGAVAILQDGREVLIGPGVEVART